MTKSSSWRTAFLLAGAAWLVTVVILVVAVAGLELNRSVFFVRASLWLGVAASAIAVLAAAFAMRALRRQVVVEEELHRSQLTFQGILTIAADAIITIDTQHRIVTFNHGAEALFGYSASEVAGQPLDLLIPDRFHVAHNRHIDDFGRDREVSRRMGERRSIFGRRKGGAEFPAEASIARLDIEGARLFSVVLRDITSRVHAEERQRFLARASALLGSSLDYDAALVAACHSGVPYLADCALLDVVEGPGEMHRLASVHEDPVRTRHLRRLEGRWPGPTNWPMPVADVMASGKAQLRRGLEPGWARTGVEDPQRVGDVEAIGVLGTITVPLQARGRVFGALTLMTTDPARPCGDEECALAETLAERVAVAIDNAWLYREARRASRARDELLGIVSHDLRNPLSAIAMCARVLAENPPAEAGERRDLATAILDSVALMQRLIQDLLDVSTIESGHLRIAPDRGDLADVARRALATVREQADTRGIELVATLPRGMPPVRMDAMRIEQVIANLLSNAVKFTDRGGRVSLTVSPDDGGTRVSVADTGIGIPADSLPHIFDRFWHTRRSGRTVGTGLGLAIAKGIVVAHGGRLDVTSQVGSGSVFSFLLPDDGARPAVPEEAGAAAGSGPATLTP